MDTMEFWHWLVLGMLLMALEIIAPAMLLMWFGFGAIITGVALWLMPSLPEGGQVLTFAVVSLVSVVAWRNSRFREENVHSTEPDLNNRLHMHIGKTFVLTEAIINGRGAIRVGDTAWRVTGADMPAGTTVRITGLEGIIFTVAKTD